MNTIRVLLFVAVNKDALYQPDVKKAFLNGDLVKEDFSNHTLFAKVSKTRRIAVLIVYMDDIKKIRY